MRKTYSKSVTFQKVVMGAALAMAVGMAGNAEAVVDINDATGTANFATQLVINATTGSDLTNAANALDVEADFGFSASSSTVRFVRVDLNNGAKFAAVPTYTVDDTNADAIPGNVSSGGNGASYVIFSVTSDALHGIDSASEGTIACATYKVYGQSTVTTRVRLYETAGEAVAQGGTPLSDASGSLLAFTTGLNVSKDAVDTSVIDVTEGSIEFFNDASNAGWIDADTTRIGDVNVLLANTVPFDFDGAVTTLGDILGAATVLTVSGDFTAAQDLTGGVPDGTYTQANVFIDNNGGCDNADTASTTLNCTTATFTLGANAVADAAELCMNVNGVSQIVDGSYTAVWTPAAADANHTASTVNLGTIGTLAKNGSTARVTCMMNPTYAYYNYIRITNPSSLDGRVYITVTDDAGVSANFPLSAVAIANKPDSILGAGDSTVQIRGKFLADAAEIANPAIDLSTESASRMRVEVDGEFGTTGTDSGIVVDLIQRSKTGEVIDQTTH